MKILLEGKGTDNHVRIIMPYIVTLVTALIAIYLLFIPNIAGVADDGSATPILYDASLALKTGETVNKEYLTTEYIWRESSFEKNKNIQVFLILLAKRVSYLFSGSRYFDIRYLAFVYLVLYLPAVFLITKSALSRTNRVGSSVVISVFAILLFSDAGYLTYFNSLYPEAIIFILFLYMGAALLRCREDEKYYTWWIALFILSSCLLPFVRKYCFFSGALASVFCFARFFSGKDRRYRLVMGVGGIVLVTISVISLFVMKNDFNQADKVNSMTRGVLFQSKNPEETLEQFGIDPSYSLLADTSTYEEYPVTDGFARSVEEGFLDQYSSLDVLEYYLKHPVSIMAMFNIAVNTNIEIIRENCGNYTFDSGKPEGSRVFWGAGYSLLKNRSFPKTIGYFAVLGIVCIILGRSNLTALREADRKKGVFLNSTIHLYFIALTSTINVIVNCGDVGFTMYNSQLGIIMDILLFFIIAEIVDRLNIFTTRK